MDAYWSNNLFIIFEEGTNMKFNALKKHYFFILFLLLLSSLFLLFRSSDAKPFPKNKLNYIGDWKSKGMSLLILSDGSVSYKRLKRGGSTSMSGPLKEFIKNDFVVGILFFTTQFNVSVPPYKSNGVWKMTVDGISLTKST
jgi:hypothetical protein